MVNIAEEIMVLDTVDVEFWLFEVQYSAPPVF